MRPLRFIYWWLSGGILLIAATAYLTLSPMSVLGDLATSVSDKFGHFIAFFVMMSWFCGVYPRGNWRLVALALLVFGIAIELVQGQLPYRSAEVADVMFDALGIVIGWFFAGLGFGRWTQMIETTVFSRSD
jgi:glycopeptide antibiotics resistance protein